MKLASLKHGRDGRLVVVSEDLTRCLLAAEVAPTLQAALDDWARCEPLLRELDERLVTPGAGEPFDAAKAASPLPRAYQWADGSAYVNHVELVRKARGAQMPQTFWTDPLMYQGGSDGFLGSRDPIPLADEAWGCDLEAEVAVTPDALGAAWDGGRLHGAMETFLNDAPLGRADSGVDMTFDFPTLIAHAAKTRALAAGTVIGSGTVSNRGSDGGPGRPIAEGGLGYSCLAEVRTVETILTGGPKTPFLKHGDRVRIDMRDGEGRSIFGAIDQAVETPR